MNCLILCAVASAFVPTTRHLQRLPSAAPITQPRVALAPTALRYADAGSEPQEAPRTGLQQFRQKLQTYINKARIFIKSEDGRKISYVAGNVVIALLLPALGGMVAPPPAPTRSLWRQLLLIWLSSSLARRKMQSTTSWEAKNPDGTGKLSLGWMVTV